MAKLLPTTILLENGADIDLSCRRGMTALMVASMKCNTNMVQLLLNHNPEVNKHNIFGKTALDYAESRDDPTIATLISQRCGSKQSMKPTHDIALQTDEVEGSEMAKLFGEYVHKGAIVKDAGMETEAAAETIHSLDDDVAAVQVQTTAVEEYDSGSDSGSDSASEDSYSGKETVSLEEESMADSQSDGSCEEESLESEVESESSSETVLSLVNAAEPGAVSKKTCEDFKNKQQALVDHAQEPTPRVERRQSLLESVEQGNIDGVKAAHARGERLSTMNADTSPLLVAVENGYEDVVRLLAEQGADCNAGGEAGKTPLCVAVENGKTSIVRILLGHGAEVDCADAVRWAPLIVAVIYGRLEVAQLLIERKANVNTKCREGRTPLHYAVIVGHMHMVQFLLDCGAAIDLADAEGHTPLWVACVTEKEELIGFLMTRRPKINVLDYKGSSILLDCAAAGKLLSATLLLDNGANINHACDGMTPLMVAAMTGNTDMVQLLLSRNADVSKHTSSGKTAVDFAERGGYLEIATR